MTGQPSLAPVRATAHPWRRAMLGSALSILLGAAACAALSTHSAPPADTPRAAVPSGSLEEEAGSLDELATWLTGSFSSGAQAARDSAFFDVRLHIVPIWKHRADARWLYVEQAVAQKLATPYRQRVYRLTVHADGSFESAVFTLRDPMRFAGAWRDPAVLLAQTPDSLVLRGGCSVVLRKEKNRYVGGTLGTDCVSDIRGAAYATSEVTVEPSRLLTLDRGFDAQGGQVWGSRSGGYEFVRVAEP